MKLVLLSTLLLIGGGLAVQEDSAEVTQNPEIINWQPVWDTEQKPIDLRNIRNNPISCVCPNSTQPLFPSRPQYNLGACDAPNGLGMRNLFNQAKALLPRERIRNIIRAAAKDPEVQAFYKLLHTPEYRRRTANFRRSREYRAFASFACFRMNCDLRLYYDFVRNVLQLSALNEPPKSGIELPQGRPGLIGVLQDIRDALPRQRLRNLFERLLATDWYLLRAVQVVQSYEFDAMFKLAQRNPDFQYLRRAQQEVGFSQEELKKLILIALGWREEEADTSDDLFIDI